MISIYATLLLTGCTSPEKNKPIWEQVKIGDLAPASGSDESDSQFLKTINFDLYAFKVPVDNISELDEVWQMLYTEPLKLNDPEAFKANLFSVGFGQLQMWDKVGGLLFTAGAKKIETISLLLFDGQPNDVPIARLNNTKTIYFISNSGVSEVATVGPGALVFRIKAEKIPGSRGVCNVTVRPVFPSPIKDQIQQSAAQEKFGDFVFTSVGFGLKMGSGDFILLGPERYIDNEITLGGLLFSRPKPQPAIRIFLLVCTRIND